MSLYKMYIIHWRFCKNMVGV